VSDQTISHYRILRHVSDGVGGRVYKAEDTILRRKVALKFLPQQLTGDACASRRFLREARSTSKIDHPNICNIHEIGETEEGDLFIAMAWYSGRTLKKHLSTSRISAIQALEFARQIALGLGRAHESGVVHRDIKPSNIIVTVHNEVKIVDFGLARLMTGARMTNTGTVLGTAFYMSPEQARGEDATPASDLWSLGVVLYEMLTGKMPFKGEQEVAVLYSVINSEPSALSLKACPEGCRCRKIIKRCLEKNPDKRYQTAEELVSDLEQALVVAREHKKRNSLSYLVRVFFASMGRPLKTAVILTVVLLMTQTIPQGRSTLQSIIPFIHRGPPLGVAVLPFSFTGANEEQQALANGLSWFTADMISRLESRSDRFWVVPPGVTQRDGINSGQDAGRLLGIGCTISGTGRINGDRISLRMTINNTWKDKQTTFTVEDNLANLKTWQWNIPQALSQKLDPDLEVLNTTELSHNMTNVPEAFREYLIGIGYSHGVNNKDDFEKAIGHFNSSVRQDSSFACSLAGLGYATWRTASHSDSSLLSSAEKYLRKATTLHPMHPRAWSQLANLLAIHGQNDEARSCFKKALTLDGVNESALRGLWNLETNTGNDDEAFIYLTRAVAARPDYFNTIDNLGVHQYYQGNFVAAESAFRQLVEIAPQQNRGFNLLGATLFEMDNYSDSEIMFENSLAIGPTYTAYSNLATLYFYSGRMLDSIEMSQKALSLDETLYHAWRTLGESYYWSPGLRDSSKAAFRKCVNLVRKELANTPPGVNSANQVLRSDLASFHVRLGEFDVARDLLDELEGESSLGIPVMFNLASSYEQIGDRTKALFWLEKAIAADLSLSQVENYPGLRNLRTHPRFLELRERYGKK